jgi:hypothetical protein
VPNYDLFFDDFIDKKLLGYIEYFLWLARWSYFIIIFS